MDNKKTRRDEVLSWYLLAIAILGVVAAFVYDGGRSSAPDIDKWYHFLFFFAGVVTTIICGIRLFAGMMAHIFRNPTFESNLLFRGETHLENWILGFLIGLAVISFELRLEQDWMFSQGL